MIPGDGNASFKNKMDTYYQLSNYSFELSGSLVDIGKINEELLIKRKDTTKWIWNCNRQKKL